MIWWDSMDSNQLVKEEIMDLQDDVDKLIAYYKRLREIISENIIIDGKIYNSEMFDRLCDDIENVKEEINNILFMYQ